MSRLPRFLRKDRTTVYHVVSRTALDGLPMKAEEKDYMLELIRKFSKLFFVDILGFCSWATTCTWSAGSIPRTRPRTRR